MGFQLLEIWDTEIVVRLTGYDSEKALFLCFGLICGVIPKTKIFALAQICLTLEFISAARFVTIELLINLSIDLIQFDAL